MKNTKSLGLIAIVAIIMLAFVACEQPTSPNKELSGTISISPDSNVTVNTELTATYSGSESVSYQWKKDDVNVGTNSDKYTPAEEGIYTVTVSAKGYKSKKSAAVNVTALSTLSGNISVSQSDLTKTEVSTGTELTANYSGDEDVSYQWYKNGVAINGATTKKYTPAEAGTYTVTVSVEGYASKTSASVTVTGATIPTLSGTVSINPNSNVTVGMELTASYNGSEGVSYQWLKGDAEIFGETNETYTPTAAGTYTVKASATGYVGKTSAPVTVSLKPITSAEIEITAPVMNDTPDTAPTTDDENYTVGAATWSPADNPFKIATVYTVTVTLTAKTDFTFTGLTTAKINGETATVSNNTGAAVTLSYKFAQTSDKAVSNITIKTQPTKLTYTHDDPLDLAGLVITLTYDDTTTEDVVAANFTAHNITTLPPHDEPLIHSTHNNQPVVIKYGSSHTVNTDNLTVNAKDIDASGITVVAIPAQTYNGSAHQPTVTVRDGEKTLTLNTDYTVTYRDNTNAGTAIVTITGEGNYSETRTQDFTINKANPTVTWPTATAITYGVALSTSTLTGGSGNGSFAWTNGTVIPIVANSGYQVMFTPTDATNYNTLTQSVSITVSKANPNVTTWPTAATITYGAALSTSTLSGGAAIVEGSFAWTNGTAIPIVANSGYQVTFTPTDAANYNTLTHTVSIIVNKADPTVTWPTGLTADYGQTLSEISLASYTNTPAGTFTWTTPTDPVGNVGTQSHSMTFTPTDTANYNTPMTQTVSITVNKANPTVTWPTGLTATYGQTLSAISLPGNGTSTPAGTFTWTTPSTSVNAVGVQSYNMTFTPTDANYNTLMQDVDITVSCQVSFNTNGGGSIADQTITTSGATASRPANPTRSSYVFDYWYTDAGLTVPYYFATPVTNNITLYAKWVSQADITTMTGKDMVFVPGGSFEMGKALGTTSSNPNVTPMSNVTLSGFYIGKYEVTQAQWQAVMGSNPSNSYGVGNNYPVYNVSWYDALVFCNKLSIAEDLTPAYRINNSTNPDDWETVPTSSNATWNAAEIVEGSTGYRLPTEAKWEYAAKGGDPTAAGWVGYKYSGSNTVTSVAWDITNSGSASHAVGTKASNGLGLYDMSGNVEEWCWDWKGDYTSADKTDPTGASSGAGRVTRGGSLLSYDGNLRSAQRGDGSPSSRIYFIGFRLARPAQ